MIDPRKLTIQRQPSSDQGTFGQFFMDGRQIAVTGELPWKNNLPDVSCIPNGTYLVVPHNSPDHPNTWEITGVPNRSEVLLHNGNTPLTESEGCILVGNTYGTVNDMKAVMDSLNTLNKLRTILPPTFYVTIYDAIPPVADEA